MHDATHAWTAPIVLLLVLAVPQIVFGLLAGARRVVGAPGPDDNGRAASARPARGAGGVTG
ncbi:hypothetical protein [Cryptosporangium sp. NPDC051539]|uniref:hypothetical protein n=1 Tax=Cryptosporangium sp. NPDC051539 TaxID=3363962 RepID=UPI00378CCF10